MNTASASVQKRKVTHSHSSLVSPLHNGNAVPWHGKGKTLLQKGLSIDRSLTLCGMNQHVGIRPACMLGEKGEVIEIADARVIYFKETGKPIKVVGNRYKVVQNPEAFDWFTPFISGKHASIETAGGLKDDNIIWMLAETSIPSVEIVAGDVVQFYIHLSHSHDGTLSIRGGFLPVRMSNWSFLSIDRDMVSNNIMKVKHTVSTHIDMETLKTVMDSAVKDFVEITHRYKKFAKIKLTEAQTLAYFKEVIAVKGEEKDIEKTLDNLMFIFQNGEGSKLAGTTLWGAYNAVCELDTWYRGRTIDTRLQSLWFGQYGETNRKALEVATSMVK